MRGMTVKSYTPLSSAIGVGGGKKGQKENSITVVITSEKPHRDSNNSEMWHRSHFI
jgi:hypothetical protein